MVVMTGREKRTKVDLYAIILEVIRRYPEGGRVTRISYGVGVPVDRLKVMLEALSANGLVRKIAAEEEEGDEAGVYYYAVTSRGLEFLETYWKMKGFLAAFGA
ncbi:MAG: winged helix-turn-helix domain-containing protein [Nitrososphaerales archaeon]